MKAVLIILVALFAGLVGGGVAGVLFPSEPGTVIGNEAPDALLGRLDGLADSLDRIEARVRRLEVAPPLASAPASASLADDAIADEEEAAAALAPAIREEDLKEKILDVVQEREASERVSREARRLEFEARRTTAMLDRLTTEQGLDAYQREKLTEILTARRKAMDAFRDRMRGGVMEMTEQERDAVRAEARKIVEDSNRQVQDLLTPAQYEAYQQLSSGGRDGFGPGRGGRGGGGGGGR